MAWFGISSTVPRSEMVQAMYYVGPDVDACHHPMNEYGGYPTRPFIDPNNKTLMEPFESPFVVLVDWSLNCSVVQQVRNAQRVGASAVLFVDPTCLCSDQACLNATLESHPNDDDYATTTTTTTTTKPTCHSTEPTLPNDGSGGDVTIPSFLLRKLDGQTLKHKLQQDNQLIQVELEWGIPHYTYEQTKLQVDLWTTIVDPTLYTLNNDHLLEFLSAMDDYVVWIPHFVVYDGTHFNCHDTSHEADCTALCTNHGRYCATSHHSTFQEKPVTIAGTAIVQETLRRICLWHHYGNTTTMSIASQERYWSYLHAFTTAFVLGTCDVFATDNHACLQDVYQHSQVDGTLIEECMVDSGGLTEDTTNAFLEQALTTQQQFGITTLPTLTMAGIPTNNPNHLLAPLTTSHMLAMICDHFVHVTTAPDICWNSCRTTWFRDVTCIGKDDHHHHHHHDDDNNNNNNSEGKKKKGRWGRFMKWMFFLGMLAGAGYLAKRYVFEDDMGDRAGGGGGMLNDYFAVSNQET